jgi:uncharacterized membrane protein HdeD (DUF308 family)
MLQEIVGRLKAPTPKFWQRVRRLGVVLGSAGAAMLAAPATLPAWIPVAGGYVVLAGGIVTALSSLTCEDQPSIPAPDEHSN